MLKQFAALLCFTKLTAGNYLNNAYQQVQDLKNYEQKARYVESVYDEIEIANNEVKNAKQNAHDRLESFYDDLELFYMFLYREKQFADKHPQEAKVAGKFLDFIDDHQQLIDNLSQYSPEQIALYSAKREPQNIEYHFEWYPWHQIWWKELDCSDAPFTGHMQSGSNLQDVPSFVGKNLAKSIYYNGVTYTQPNGQGGYHQLDQKVTDVIALTAKAYADGFDQNGNSYPFSCKYNQDGTPFTSGCMWQGYTQQRLDESDKQINFWNDYVVCTPYATGNYGVPNPPVCPPYYTCSDSSCSQCYPIDL